jgi:hypothetical protein
MKEIPSIVVSVAEMYAEDYSFCFFSMIKSTKNKLG